MANIIGPDISFYQDDPQTPQGVNFIKMRESAYYVIVRAGQNLWGDRDFKVNWREAKAAGLPRGSYWFYDSRVDPKLQAEKWVSMFDGDFGELPLWGDFEDTYNGPFRGWKNWYNFIERVKQLIPSNKEIGVYTGYYYWRENTAGVGIPNASLQYFEQYPLWIANYGVNSPLVPQPWDTWTLWQFTDNGDGAIYGVESLNIDLNYFNGDLAAFRQRFGLSDTPLPPPPPPSKNYRVTVASLKVREGAGLSFNQIGSITLNKIVEKIGANADGTWLNIRTPDGSLTGWSFAAYLQNISGSSSDTPTDDSGGTGTGGTGGTGNTDTGNNNPPPDEEDTNWYRVTASSLKIRTGPGLEYDSTGTFTFGELVEKLDTSPNNQWIKARSKDGTRTGWSFGEYLISVHNPSNEPPPSVVTPAHSDKNWYRVNTSSLNLRETPNLTAKIISTLVKNDVVPGLDESNAQWLKTEKLDGSTGWISRDFLIQVSTSSRPNSITQKLFSGVTYLRKDLTSPRPIVVHVLVIDLQTLKLEFLVTPSSNNTDVLCTRTTSQFLEEFKLHAAINGGYFSYLDSSNDPVALCPNGGDPVRISDYAASRGKIYSPKKTAQPVVHIGKKNQFTFNNQPGQVFNAVSGDRMVVTDGKVVKNLAAQVPNPRTAIGLNRNGRWLTLMVVDGRQTGYSEGVTFPELAELLISYGVHTGANMDGGGSSAMVIRGVDGKARVLNSPIEMNQPGKERPVGNHLGLFIKP
ncbi:MAG: SH3 domain-containing protein [Anaerolineales bacterium]|nr:SH3 domain-containing protein [Anaerolineales bacterium]